jgi:hypothetical protein
MTTQQPDPNVVAEFKRMQEQLQSLMLQYYEYVDKPTLPHGSTAVSDDTHISLTLIHGLQEGGFCQICDMIRANNGNHAIIHIMSDSHGVPHTHE